MKQTLKRTLIAAIATVLLVPVAASAQDGGGSSGNRSSDTATTSSVSPSSRTEKQRAFEQELRERLQEAQKKRQEALTDKREDLQQRLDEAKKKACENHKETVNRLMERMDKRRQNAFDKITEVSEAVQAFYTNKQLTIENYDDLVAAVTAAQSAAQASTEAQLAIPNLNCDGDHPRADMSDFKEKRAASIDAMKEYRDAVKQLIQAVRTAAQEDKSDEQ